MKIRTILFIHIIFFLLPGMTKAQQPVTITVEAGAEKSKISPFIYGKNNSLSDNSGNPVSSSEWQKLKDLGITIFRESGGNNSTKYNWRRKLSSHPDWYNNVYVHNWRYAAQSLQEKIPSAQGMWSFQLIGYAAKTDAHNFYDWGYNQSQGWSGVHQNLAGGGVVDPEGGSKALEEGNPDLYLEEWPADSTVKILEHWFSSGGIELDSSKIRYWGMDNEPEIWNGTHDDVMPEQISAEEFMQKYFAVAKKARAFFPGIKLCGPVPANEWQWFNWKNDVILYNGKKYVWLEYFIKRVAEEQEATGIRLLDVLDIHFYPGESEPEDIVQLHRIYFDKNYVYPGANGVKRINGGWDNSQTKEYIFARCEEWLEKHLGTEHGVTLGVSETGVSGNNPNVTASWYASTLGEFAKNGVDFFTPWSWKTGMNEVIHLFSNYAHSYFSEGNSSDETYVSAYPTISENADSMTLLLVNRHLSETKTVQIDVRDFTIKNAPIEVLTLSELPNDETFVSHNQNALKHSEIVNPEFNLEMDLKPLSITAVLLEAAPSSVRLNKADDLAFKIFPNPVKNTCYAEFSIKRKSKVQLVLHNASGQPVSTITDNFFFVGNNSVEFDMSSYPPGIYFLTLQTQGSKTTKKITVIQ